jgi:hypothetical protein
VGWLVQPNAVTVGPVLGPDNFHCDPVTHQHECRWDALQGALIF